MSPHDDQETAGRARAEGKVVKMSWFAVRCLFRFDGDDDRHLYEERITLWRADSFEEAIARAEDEARAYVAQLDEASDACLDLAQAYELAEEPADGAEVFSLIRGSALGPAEYIARFFDSGTERQHQL